jgi:formate C-acetyltransferase
MNERVARLRRASLDARPSISAERARLVTAYYRHADLRSAPMHRALTFKHLLEQKEVWLGEGELIVGERGPAPKATPTYPEVCCHTLEDLETLHSREKTAYIVDEETRRIYAEEVIPFWQGRTLRERILGEMSKPWLDAYQCGIFTEFMEQRAPGHTVADDKIYREGLLGFIARIDRRYRELDFLTDPRALARRQQLTAMRICAEAIILYARRHAEKALELAAAETDPLRKAELQRIGRICERVPAHAPADFQEALQSYWFIHLGVISELNPWDAFNPGRLDQHLLSFYRDGLRDGALTEESARELLQCFWIKFNNQPAPPKVGVTAAESGTYTDFANINVGGLRPDGSDGVNEVSFLLLEVIDEMRLLQPGSNIQLSRKNPEPFLRRACAIVRQGWGQPSMFNADAVVAELLGQGKTLQDARCGGTSGCVEAGAFGKEAYILTGYFNLPKVLEITLNNGRDPLTGLAIGLATGNPAEFKTFEDLLDAFRRQLRHFVEIKVGGNNIIERLYAEEMPAPCLSLLIDDCIDKGMDYNDGGARYNTSYIQGVGLATISDSLAAIAHHVFNEKTVSMGDLLAALADDFDGNEPLRLRLRNKSPRYGNDDDRADDIMRRVFELYHQAIDGRPNTRGGQYRINLLPTTCHIYFGQVTGATPEGRRAGTPLSEGISPVQGSDRKGPTAVLRSAAKMDHLRTGGTLLNQKFTPKLLEGEEGIDSLAALVRTYFKLDGHHLQFNVVSAETLRQAQADPGAHRDLIVRVAGYSDYFCDLGQALQDEIIGRTEHESM